MNQPVETTNTHAVERMLELPPIAKPAKLSVVIPVYNEKRWVEQILERVLAANTLGCALEIVVVDDASTDGTGEILDSLAKKIPALKLVHQRPNAGKGA